MIQSSKPKERVRQSIRGEFFIYVFVSLMKKLDSFVCKLEQVQTYWWGHLVKITACFLVNTTAYFLNFKILQPIASAYDCQLACQNDAMCTLTVYSLLLNKCWLKSGLTLPYLSDPELSSAPAFCEGILL